MTATLDRPAEAAPAEPTPEEAKRAATIEHLRGLLDQFETQTPTGAVPWPMILVDGEEKAGKSWDCAEFTGSPRVGRCFWLEWGFEGSANEYGAVPGAKYEIVPFNGLRGFEHRLRQLRDIAIAAREAGEKPVVIIVDTMTAEWKALSQMAEWMARQPAKAQKILANDPHAQITVTSNYWNDVRKIHYRLLNILASTPAIVVLTARGKEVTAFENGKPVENKTTWSVDAERQLGFDATAWVRKHRGKDGRPGKNELIGVRSVHAGIRAGEDKPIEAPRKGLLDWLVFDYMKCDPDKAYCRTISQDGADDDREEEARRQAERGAEVAQRQAQPQQGQQNESRGESARRAPAPAPRPSEQPPLERIRNGLLALNVEDYADQLRLLSWAATADIKNPRDLTEKQQQDALAELLNLVDIPDKGWVPLVQNILNEARTAEAARGQQ